MPLLELDIYALSAGKPGLFGADQGAPTVQMGWGWAVYPAQRPGATKHTRLSSLPGGPNRREGTKPLRRRKLVPRLKTPSQRHLKHPQTTPGLSNPLMGAVPPGGCPGGPRGTKKA
jgi:hypothetical protein